MQSCVIGGPQPANKADKRTDAASILSHRRVGERAAAVATALARAHTRSHFEDDRIPEIGRCRKRARGPYGPVLPVDGLQAMHFNAPPAVPEPLSDLAWPGTART